MGSSRREIMVVTKCIPALAIAIGLSAIPGTSYAYSEWNINATSCVADAGSIQNNLYIGTGGTIKFASGKTGDIVLYCPVPNLGFMPSVLGLTYYDDAATRGSHVTAQLIKMEIGSGALFPIVTIDSDGGAVTAQGAAGTVGHEFTDNYEPKTFAYYIRIDIIRNTPTANETVYSVSLLD